MQLSKEDLLYTGQLNRILSRNHFIRQFSGLLLVLIRLFTIFLVLNQFGAYHWLNLLFRLSLKPVIPKMFIVYVFVWMVSEFLFRYIENRYVSAFIGIQFNEMILLLDGDNGYLRVVRKCKKRFLGKPMLYSLTPHQIELVLNEIQQLLQQKALKSDAVLTCCVRDFANSSKLSWFEIY